MMNYVPRKIALLILWLSCAGSLTQTLNAQSRPTITDGAPSNQTSLQGWMMPLMLSDLAELDYLRAENKLLLQQVNSQKQRIKADSLSRNGSALTCDQLQQEVVTLRATSSDGWKKAEYWQSRYRKANTERWVGRGLGLLYLALRLRSIY